VCRPSNQLNQPATQPEGSTLLIPKLATGHDSEPVPPPILETRFLKTHLRFPLVCFSVLQLLSLPLFPHQNYICTSCLLIRATSSSQHNRLHFTLVTLLGALKLATHLHILPRLITRGAIPPLTHTSSWHSYSCITFGAVQLDMKLHCDTEPFV